MGITYDMASGRIQSAPAQEIATPARDEILPALAVREVCPAGLEGQAQSHAIHLIRALLGKN